MNPIGDEAAPAAPQEPGSGKRHRPAPTGSDKRHCPVPADGSSSRPPAAVVAPTDGRTRQATGSCIVGYLNMDGAEGTEKQEALERTCADIEEKTGASVGAFGITETKLSSGAKNWAPRGFRIAAAKNRRGTGGGGVAWLVRVDWTVTEHKIDGPFELVAIDVHTNDAKVIRFILGYLPPLSTEYPAERRRGFFEALRRQLDLAEEEGIPVTAGGDWNHPKWDGARQTGTRFERAERPSPGPDHGMAACMQGAATVVSGTIDACGGTNHKLADTHYRPHLDEVQNSELDFIVMSKAALAVFEDCQTENGARGDRVAWAHSHHRPVWTKFRPAGVQICHSKLPTVRPPPRANWPESDEEKKKSLAADIDRRLRGLLDHLQRTGLDHWGGRLEPAMKEIMSAALEAETRTIGRSKAPRRASLAERWRPPPWWTEDLETARNILEETTTDIARAVQESDPVLVTENIQLLRLIKVHYAKLRRAAFAGYLQGRLACARSGPAVEKIYEEIRGELGIVGGKVRMAPHCWATILDPLREAGEQLIIGCDKAAAVLEREIKASFADDPETPRFSRTAAASRQRDHDQMEAEIRRANDADLAAAMGPNWDQESWRLQVLYGEIDKSGDEDYWHRAKRAYEAAPVRVVEVERATRRKRAGTAPSPEDGISSEVLKHGGKTLHTVLSLIFDLILQDPRRIPASWRVAYRRDIYKGGDKDPLSWLSYRGIALSSNIAKCFELVLLDRMEVISKVDELQAVGNCGVDARMQLHLVLDIIAERAALGQPTWLVPVDLTRGFPTTERASAALALRKEGVGGRILRTWMELISGTSVRAGITRHQYTNAIPLGTGLFEGAVLSPRGFAAHTGTLIQRLRDSGLGAVFGGVWCGSPMFMDDLLLIPKTEDELQPMLQIVLDWCYEFRMTVSQEKTKIVLINSHLAPPARATVMVVINTPRADLEPDPARRSHRLARTTMVLEVQTKGVTYLGYLLGGKMDHVNQQIRMTREATRKIEGSGRSRAGLKLGQALWGWTAFGRPNAEWPAAVWPVLAPSKAAVLEKLQVRALLGLLGDATICGMIGGRRCPVTPVRAVVLTVFGLWSLTDRRILAQISYAAALILANARPRRAQIHEHAQTLAKKKNSLEFDRTAFTAQSTTAALAQAEAAVRRREKRADIAPAPAEEDGYDDDRIDEPDDDAAAIPQSPSDAEDEAGTREQENGTPAATEQAPDTASVDNPVKEARCAVRRAAQSRMKRLVGIDRQREVSEAAAGSGAICAALAPSQRWLREALWEQELNGELAALVAAIIGVWWAAPLVRTATGGAGEYMARRCGACGCEATADTNLVVHLVCGEHGGTRCTGAVAVRATFEAEVESLFEQYGLSARYSQTPRYTVAWLALVLGNGGNNLPKELSRALPNVFTRTFGRWSEKSAPPHTTNFDAAPESDEETPQAAATNTTEECDEESEIEVSHEELATSTKSPEEAAYDQWLKDNQLRE